MEIAKFEFNYFGENTYVMWNIQTKQAAIVDPGMMNTYEINQLNDFIKSHELKPIYILLTHVHVDHTLGIEFLKETYGLPVLAHKSDAPLGMMRPQQATMFHLPVTPGILEIDRFITDGETICLGDECIHVITTPGHSPGSVCYLVSDSGFVLTGDTLFQGSVGRTDLPGGNHNQLLSSIRNQLMKLPPSTIVYPGHGPSTTIAQEAASNPFIN